MAKHGRISQRGLTGLSHGISSFGSMSSLSSGLYGEPFVSIRESIAWIPSTPAFEDSDVLVLSSRSTSPGNAGAVLFYLDLRLSIPLGRASTLNWGFAGLRHTLSTEPNRFRWTHSVIDSRSDAVADEGEVTYRDGIEIETGVGLNPATGQMEAYEEIWRDEPLPAGSPYVFVSRSENVEEATGVMAVLGPHALALSRETEDPNMPRTFQAVRMQRQASVARDTPTETAWGVVFSTGSLAQEQELSELVGFVDLACRYARGGTIRLGGRSWVIWDAGREGGGAA